MAYPLVDNTITDSVMKCLESGWISSGPRVAHLEALVAQFCGTTHAVAMNNGTSTLHALMLALGVGPGDEVIVPNLSYISPLFAIAHVGAVPVICSYEPNTFNVTSSDVREAISHRTKAVISVDMKGQPVDYNSINELCSEFGIAHIADSAESFGAVYRGQRVGAQALAHSFSFFANKMIFAGEGGIITTNDPSLADRLKRIRNQGQSERYVHSLLGHNFRMPDLVAAVVIPQIEQVAETLTLKKSVVNKYNRRLNVSGARYQLPVTASYVDLHAHYCYTLTFREREGKQRLANNFDRLGIEYRTSFPMLSSQPLLEKLDFRITSSPESDNYLFERMIDIPCHHNMTDEQIDLVTEAITADQ